MPAGRPAKKNHPVQILLVMSFHEISFHAVLFNYISIILAFHDVSFFAGLFWEQHVVSSSLGGWLQGWWNGYSRLESWWHRTWSENA